MSATRGAPSELLLSGRASASGETGSAGPGRPQNRPDSGADDSQLSLDEMDYLIGFYESLLEPAARGQSFAAVSRVVLALRDVKFSFGEYDSTTHSAFCSRVLGAAKLADYCVVCQKLCPSHNNPGLRIVCPKCQCVEFCSGYCSLEPHSHPCELFYKVRMLANLRRAEEDTARSFKDAMLERVAEQQESHRQTLGRTDREIAEADLSGEIARAGEMQLQGLQDTHAEELLSESDLYIAQKLAPICDIVAVTRKYYSAASGRGNSGNVGVETASSDRGGPSGGPALKPAQTPQASSADSRSAPSRTLMSDAEDISAMRLKDPFTYAFILQIAYLFSGGMEKIREERQRLDTVLTRIRALGTEFKSNFDSATLIFERLKGIMLEPPADDLDQIRKAYDTSKELLAQLQACKLPEQCRAQCADIERIVYIWNETRIYNFLVENLNRYSDTVRGIRMHTRRKEELSAKADDARRRIEELSQRIEDAKFSYEQLSAQLDRYLHRRGGLNPAKARSVPRPREAGGAGRGAEPSTSDGSEPSAPRPRAPAQAERKASVADREGKGAPGTAEQNKGAGGPTTQQAAGRLLPPRSQGVAPPATATLGAQGNATVSEISNSAVAPTPPGAGASEPGPAKAVATAGAGPSPVGTGSRGTPVHPADHSPPGQAEAPSGSAKPAPPPGAPGRKARPRLAAGLTLSLQDIPGPSQRDAAGHPGDPAAVPRTPMAANLAAGMAKAMSATFPPISRSPSAVSEDSVGLAEAGPGGAEELGTACLARGPPSDGASTPAAGGSEPEELPAVRPSPNPFPSSADPGPPGALPHAEKRPSESGSSSLGDGPEALPLSRVRLAHRLEQEIMADEERMGGDGGGAFGPAGPGAGETPGAAGLPAPAPASVCQTASMLDSILRRREHPPSPSRPYDPLRELFSKDFFQERLRVAYRDLKSVALRDTPRGLQEGPAGPVSNLILTFSKPAPAAPVAPLQNPAIESSVAAVRRLASASFARPDVGGITSFQGPTPQERTKQTVVFNYKRLGHFLNELARVSSHNDAVFYAKLWKLLVWYGAAALRVRSYYSKRLKKLGDEGSAAMTLLLLEEQKAFLDSIGKGHAREVLGLRFERYAYEKAAYARLNLSLSSRDDAQAMGAGEVLDSLLTPEQRERISGLSALTVDTRRLPRQARVRLYCGLTKYITDGSPITADMVTGKGAQG